MSKRDPLSALAGSKHDTLSELADAIFNSYNRTQVEEQADGSLIVRQQRCNELPNDVVGVLTCMGFPVRVDPTLKPGEWRLPTTSPSREVEYLTARLKMAESANATLAARLARADAEKQSMVAEIADLKASINAMSLASMVNAVSSAEVRPLIEELREHTLSRGTLAKCNAVLERLK